MKRVGYRSIITMAATRRDRIEATMNAYLIVQSRAGKQFGIEAIRTGFRKTPAQVAYQSSPRQRGHQGRLPMRLSWIDAILPALVVCNGAMAQVSGMASPTPTIGATSPLGMGTGSTVSPTGIPLGSTEMASPGISPAPTGVTGTIAMPSSGTTCSTVGTPPTGMFGSTSSLH